MKHLPSRAKQYDLLLLFVLLSKIIIFAAEINKT